MSDPVSQGYSRPSVAPCPAHLLGQLRSAPVACSVGTPQLGGMQPSRQAARFPASLPAPARAPPPPSRLQATTAEWGKRLSPYPVLGKEGLGAWIPGS